VPNQKLLFPLIGLLICQLTFGQDTVVKKDSTEIYRKIEAYSKKRKFTRFVHGLIFEPLSTKTVRVRNRNLKKANFRKFHGKIIREITIQTLDPFGYSEVDTAAKPRRRFSRVGNALHLKSKEITIWNLLLIRRNKPLDSLLVKESERLIRSQRYIRRVVITPRLISKKSDSIDVDIRVLDSWSLIPDFAGSPSRITAKLTDRNFLGFGHQVENTYRSDLKRDRDAYSVKYTVPNIMNTYIRTTLTYDIDLDANYTKSIDIERPFFSPFARWAAGAYIGQVYLRDSLPNQNFEFARQNFNYVTRDLWVGHAYSLFPGESEDDRTTNLITAARYLRINYRESPDIEHDPANFYADESLCLGAVGIASRQFVEDKYVFNYGIVEDVPVGTAAGITGGVQNKNGIKRPYFGARVTRGQYFEWGYLSGNLEYGSFYNDGHSEQGAIAFQSNYFTKLIEAGSWKFRQFVKAQVIIGNNRVESRGDYLTLNEDREGIAGFGTRNLFGTKKWLMMFQTQSYSPWNAWGFRLNPFLTYTMGMLGNSEQGFSNSRLYSQVGIGLIISNDYLVFSNFQVSFSFYPVIPDVGNNIFKSNAIRTEDFGFQDFSLDKPRTVYYE
jgi:hypothetical protein